MPDATITSTASTFGTISGTFAADQSTVTGTVTGIVAGTLTGSVGVPGPQGPTGATGATGATGPAGSPGAPGQGVPVGGTAGQFLSKIDSTNYNTDWTTVNLSVYAVKANNLSDLADAPTARTNLGLGTMATATAADYSTTTVANGLYYPLSGNPSGFLTSVPPPTLTNLTSDISWDGSANIGRLLIAGVNDIGGGQTEARLNFVSGVPTQPATGDFWTNGTDFFYASGGVKTIASQSYVSATYQTLAGMSSYLTTASAAATYFTIASAANKADLASPTFTGTPTLPTGTIATTQSPGNNTTALATTAFVTAAVPAIATFAESQQLTSTTAVMSPFDTITAMMTEGYRPALGMTGGSSGTGAGVNPIMPQYIGLGGPNSGVAGSCHAVTNTAGGYITGVDPVSIKFNKPIWLSGSFRINTAGDSNNNFKAYIGTSMLNGNDPTGPSIGWYRQGGASMPISLMVHNGTTLTKVASASSYGSGSTAVIRYMVYSDGAGNVTLYINGTSVATTALGPTGSTTAAVAQFTASTSSTASSTARVYFDLYHPKIFIAPQ